jgi:peptide/nickel transport system permease protein
MRSWRGRAWRSPQFIIGSAVLILILTTVLFGSLLAPYRPETFNTPHRLEGPSLTFWLGTDQFGRDLLSRILAGARATVLFGVVATAMATVLGLFFGVVSGYMGGIVEDLIMRLMDALMAIPTLLKALLIVTVLGASSLNAMIAVGIAFTPGLARIARSTTLIVRSSDYVSAAIARGERSSFIMIREVLPNVVAPVIVESSIRAGFAIMLGATLSFLGLGAQPPSSEWGLMVAEAGSYMFRNPWIVAGPGFAIALVSIGFNLFGDGLRDALNPRLGQV